MFTEIIMEISPNVLTTVKNYTTLSIFLEFAAASADASI
jgi:hypothetical protein